MNITIAIYWIRIKQSAIQYGVPTIVSRFSCGIICAQKPKSVTFTWPSISMNTVPEAPEPIFFNILYRTRGLPELTILLSNCLTSFSVIGLAFFNSFLRKTVFVCPSLSEIFFIDPAKYFSCLRCISYVTNCNALITASGFSCCSLRVIFAPCNKFFHGCGKPSISPVFIL
ncbi:hypothetical protein DERP_006133 [Dermatophagoides pteronyssinus]|uniref:Uncharacterized protein n=1 Tax=Dermatophagoides pteronyssinus TaxID=6956 RepID=A0ABQ8JSE0_DERPT|nr:hypothetical protein DERP_006133 [Dermatophagoides pteronyssinus]